MTLDEIEHKIACNELNAAQVFTQMKQHIEAAQKISKIHFSIASSRIGSDAVIVERDKFLSENASA